MPCPSQGLPRQPGVEITDLLELHRFTAGVKYEPRNKAELVAAVVASARGPQSLRALGTNYSLSIAAVADDVVDTSSLQMHLSQPFPASTAPLDQRRLRDGGSDFLAKVCAGVGRMGVIYSIILEVVPAYGLIEVNLEHRWSEIRAQLSTSRITAGNVSGIFDTPLSDLDSGWFRSQVLDRSEKYYPYGFRYI